MGLSYLALLQHIAARIRPHFSKIKHCMCAARVGWGTTQHPEYYPVRVVKNGDFFFFLFCTPSSKVAQSYISASPSTVPGAPPRRVEVEVLNSTALKVMWRSLTPGKQNGQIRGYQVHYVRVENGESRGLPLIKDVMLADAQVRSPRSSFRTN